jgi:hypothetical protein
MAQTFGADENPAEVMLEVCRSFQLFDVFNKEQVIGAAPGSETTIDWPQVWNDSPERQGIKTALADMKEKLSQNPVDHHPTALDPCSASLHPTPDNHSPSLRTIMAHPVLPVLQNSTLHDRRSLHRVFSLVLAQLAARDAKPALLNFHAAHCLWKFVSTNHATFRNTERFIRIS